MPVFAVSHDTSLSPEQAWARLVDWPQHGRWVPFTTVTYDPPNGIGTVFVAHSGIGRVGFDDPMEITVWDPPDASGTGHARMEKRGRVMHGWAELTVRPKGGGARATWREDVVPAHLPRFAYGAARVSSKLLFGRVLRKLLET